MHIEQRGRAAEDCPIDLVVQYLLYYSINTDTVCRGLLAM